MQTTQQQPVTVTAEAVQAVKDFQADNEVPGSALRVSVKGGGCSGFKYSVALDTPNDDDVRWEQDGLLVVSDQMSLRYLTGATLRYVDKGLSGKGFEFDNPNVVAACGCGDSFRVDDQGACGTPGALDDELAV